jgi:hypothetical protein
MTDEAQRNKLEVKQINAQYSNGELSYDEAVEKLEVIADRINVKGRAIAKKYNKRYSNYTAKMLLAHSGRAA